MEDVISEINNYTKKQLLETWSELTSKIDTDLQRKKWTDETLEKVKGEIVTLSDAIEKMKNQIRDKELSQNYQVLLRSFLESLSRIIDSDNVERFQVTLELAINNAEKLRLLISLSTIDNTAIIVGANGSGKSTFVNTLSETTLTNLTVIPAQKNLYFSKTAYMRMETDVSTYKSKHLTSTNDAYKTDDELESQAIERIFEPFTMMITAIVNDVAQISTNERNIEVNHRTITTWDNIIAIWGKMIPEVTFRIDATNRTLIAQRNGDEYSINRLSDGEKCILFYIGNVLLADENSYIVVDEPETFLNPAIYNKLWDMLIATRGDCQFIFASHNVEFISARSNATIVWCKQFTPPDNITLRPLNMNGKLPMPLLTELVGSRRRILFCEGTYDSPDYQIFSALFMDEYTVKPVGGHDKVIEYTRVFNELPEWVENSAVGVIDSDGIDSGRLLTLNKNHITVLPYNEIEMLLLDEKVMESVLMLTLDEDEVKNYISNFKQEMVQIVKKRKEEIIYNLAKNNIDSVLRNQFIDSKDGRTLDTLKLSVKDLMRKIDVGGIIRMYSERFEQAINNQDYVSILELCTLKQEVTNGLANRYLQREYVRFAFARIRKDSNLQVCLKKKMNIASIRK